MPDEDPIIWIDKSAIPTESAKQKEVRLAELREELRSANFGQQDFHVALGEYIKLVAEGDPSVHYRQSGPIDPTSLEKMVVEIRTAYAVLPQSEQTIDRLDDLIRRRLNGISVGTTALTSDGPRQRKAADADPVTLFNGQFVLSEVDATIECAGIDFVFRRFYKNQAIYRGPLGFKWTHSYNLWLRIDDAIIFRASPSLREDAYIRHPRFGSVGFNYWAPPDGQYGVIFQDSGRYVWRSPSGVQHTFEESIDEADVHRVSLIKDRYGNELRFDYDGRSLARIWLNSNKRFVRFYHDTEDRICSMSDHTGRAWHYSYDWHGDLVMVSSPSASRNKAHFGFSTRIYQYSSSRYQDERRHNLERIIDADGHEFLHNTYGNESHQLSFNRVTRQRMAGGEFRFYYEDVATPFAPDSSILDRPAHRTTVLSPNGQTIRHVFNSAGNLLCRQQYVFSKGIRRPIVEHYRYNEDGETTLIISPEGRATQFGFARDAFRRRERLRPGTDFSGHMALTAQDRQQFANLLVIVKRADPIRQLSVNLGANPWRPIVDDIFSSSTRSDVITKYRYEPEFSQLVAVSHPNFTDNPDPTATSAPFENPRYQETLTSILYDGPHIESVVWPQPTRPNGSKGPAPVWRFEHDAKGRISKVINPIGLVLKQNFQPIGDAREGYLREVQLEIDSDTISTHFSVDELGRVIQLTLPNGSSSHFEYTVTDQITRITDPLGNEERFVFNGQGLLVRRERDLLGPLSPYVDDPMEITMYDYDEYLNLDRITYGGNRPATTAVIRYFYDTSGRRSRTTLPRGNSSRNLYDERNFLASSTQAYRTIHESTVRWSYDDDGLPVELVDGRGNRTGYQYDTLGRLARVETPKGTLTIHSRDKVGRVVVSRVFERRPSGYFLLNRTHTLYDELGQPTRLSEDLFDEPQGPFPLESVESAFRGLAPPGREIAAEVIYDANGRRTKVVDENGNIYLLGYDKLDRLTSVEDPLSNTVRNTFDKNGNLIRRDWGDVVRDPLTGLPISEQHFASSFAYDVLDRLTEFTDSAGNTNRFAYDTRSNLTLTQDSLGNARLIRYDVRNRLIKTISSQTDNGLGNGSIAPPIARAVSYDDNDNLIEAIDPLGHSTRYEYDEKDRATRIIYPDGTSRTLEYDENDNVTSRTAPTHIKRLFTYDADDNLTFARTDKSALGGAPQDSIGGATFETYEYDGLGRRLYESNDYSRTWISRNSIGWPIKEASSYQIPIIPQIGVFTVEREFRASGSLVGLTYPNGRRLEFDRDELDRLTNIRPTANGTDYPGFPTSLSSIARFFYAGRLRRATEFGNASNVLYSYDQQSRLTEILNTWSNAASLRIQYLHDSIDNVRVRSSFSNTQSSSNKFCYDSAYRLVSAKAENRNPFNTIDFAPSSAPLNDPIPVSQLQIDTQIGPLDIVPGDETITYDRAGNRTQLELSGIPTRYSTNGINQYTSVGSLTCAYDLTGNMVWDSLFSYSYDSQNRLVRAADPSGSSITEFFYDSRGRRIVERFGTSTNILLHDGNFLLAEYSGAVPTALYAHDDRINRPIHIAANGTDHWFHADAADSVVALSDRFGASAARYDYDTFGTPAPSNPIAPYNPFLFAGSRYDRPLGTSDFRSREYYPRLGRFMQRDPKGPIDDDNLYTYAGNNPLSETDPYGTEREKGPGATPTPPSLTDLQKSTMLSARQWAKGKKHVFQAVDPAGNPLGSKMNLWSGVKTGKVEAARAPGFILEDSKAAANLALEHLRSGANPNNLTPHQLEQWEDLSRDAVRATTLRGGSFNSFGLDTHPSPHTTVQSRIELKMVRKFGWLLGAEMKLSGLLNIVSAAQTDNGAVRAIGILGGSAELVGGTLYWGGLLGPNSRFMEIGSKLSKWGSVGGVVVSFYNLAGDIRRGDVENGVGNAASGTASALAFLGWAPGAAVVGSFSVGYELGRAGNWLVKRFTGYDSSDIGDWVFDATHPEEVILVDYLYDYVRVHGDAETKKLLVPILREASLAALRKRLAK